MAKDPAKIPVDEVVRGAKLVLENGADLVADAELLYEAGRYARAASLAILAMEEFGKLPRLLGVDRYEREGRMKEWWRYFRSHDRKAGINALVTANELEPDDSVIADLPENWHRRHGSGLASFKLRTLYVDFIDGSFVAPGDIEEMAERAAELIALAEASLTVHRSHIDDLEPETHDAIRGQMGELIEWLQADEANIDSFLEGREDEPSARALRRMIDQKRKKVEPKG